MELIRLAPMVWQLHLPVGHVHLVRLTTGGFAAIDTGVAGSAPAVLDALAELGGSPSDLRQIVLTHSHLDHMGSAADLVVATGARVLAGALDAPYIRGDLPEREPVLTDRERALHRQVTEQLTHTGMAHPPRVRVDVELDEGDALDDWGEPARVLHTPGHTPGSIALHLPDSGVLFTGDTVGTLEGRALLGPFNADRQQAITSFRRLASLAADIVCVPHGAPLTHNATKALRAATPESDWL